MIRGLAGALSFAACVAHVVAIEQLAGGLRAGAARIEITPKPSDLTTATDSIRDPLFARAVVVDDGSAQAWTSQSWQLRQSRRACRTGSGGRTPTALVSDAVTRASAATGWPARIGYGHTKVDLNVNRDLFNSKLEWRQEANPDGPSDKTLAVVEFLGVDNVPIAVYMNYAMHPINFYLSGVISADFPGEASHYIEELFDNRTTAIFSQGASGDQNPRDFRSPTTFMGQRAALMQGRGPFVQTIGPAPVAPSTSPQGFNARQASAERRPIPAESLDAYKKTIARTGEYVHMLGLTLGSSAVRVLRESTQPVDHARIWSGQQTFACPGRIRNDADNPARENVFPGYKDGPEVNLEVGVLRIGDVHFVSVNGEVYSQIGMRIKAEAPASQTMVVTLANGSANSGYIYADEAYSHLTFQVIGSRLKPGCAESRIVSTAVDLMRQSQGSFK